MNVYHCHYYMQTGWSGYIGYDAIIVANTESEALGIALQQHTNTISAHWIVNQIDTNVLGVAYSEDWSN